MPTDQAAPPFGHVLPFTAAHVIRRLGPTGTSIRKWNRATSPAFVAPSALVAIQRRIANVTTFRPVNMSSPFRAH